MFAWTVGSGSVGSKVRVLMSGRARVLLIGILVGLSCAPSGVLAQDDPVRDLSLGVVLRAGAGPAATLAAGLAGTHPLSAGLGLRAEALKAFQGLESCEDEFPRSQRCASSPWMGVVALSWRRPARSWSFGLDAGAGLHLEEEAFGGASPLLHLGGAFERSIGDRWILESTVVAARALNGTWEDRIGDPLGYLLIGIGIRQRWTR